MSMMRRTKISFALACTLGFSLTSNAALANSATFDTSLGDRPCEVLTARMVATTFDIPEKSLQQSNLMKYWCSYDMEKNGKNVSVNFQVLAFDNKKAAAESFRDSTRSMSAEEMTEKLKALGVEFDESDIQFARDLGLSDPRPTGLQFEDVDGVADQARFLTSEGSLHLLQDNLQITLNAFYGTDMKMPDEITFEALEKTTSAWKQDTMSQRKEQAITLAKAALTAL